MRALARALFVFWCLWGAAGASAQTDRPPELVPLVTGLPWEGVSSLIPYRGKLWFANSVKFVNHNSADLYSFDPATGRHRYEKQLFSQDAGDPVVANGLLYWPFEDSRFSPGQGEMMVTNGRDWGWHVIKGPRAFHTHAMTGIRGRLYAALSAWKTSIATSADGGVTWKSLWNYPSPERRVSRITALTVLGDRLYAGVSAGYDPARVKLFVMTVDGASMMPVPGWPAGETVSTLGSYKGWVYGVNETANGYTLWRTDGGKSERLRGPDGVIDAFASDGAYLWAVTARRSSGALWRTPDGINWQRVHGFAGARPLDVTIVNGAPFVGLLNKAGGELWGVESLRNAPAKSPLPPLPQRKVLSGAERDRAFARLDTVLADPARFGELRFAMRPLAMGGGPEVSAAVQERLTRPVPAGSIRMFGRRQIPASQMAQWYLLWGISHSGIGNVPVSLLRRKWTAPPNGAEKYIEPQLAAIWAVRQLSQRDGETIAALIGRVGRKDPKWVRGDAVGALVDLTGERLGYDATVWQRWWEQTGRKKFP